MPTRILMAALLLAALPILDTSADETWPQFRGVGATGVASDDLRLPESWDTTENVQWVTDIPGWGWSCPIVWKDKVFLTTVVSDSEYELPKKGLYLGGGRSAPPKGTHQWLVYCFDLKSGGLRWKQEAHRGQPQVSRHPKSTFASETPTTDGERLYVLFGDVGLYCYSLEGEPLWSHRIEAKKTMADYGAAASPIVHGNQVVLVYDNQEQSYIAAFDTKTGAQNWRTNREERSTWATPLVWQNSRRTEIVTAGKLKNRSYDLAGNLLWEFDGRMSNLIVPSPLAAHGMLYLTSGYVGDAHRPVYAIKPGGEGDITPEGDPATSEFIEWYQPEAGPYNPSPIVYGDYYYTLYDRGFVTCHDAHTGKQVYGKQRFAPGASFTASPWAYNGKLFFLSEDGDTYVIEAGPNYKLLGTNRLDELCAATPAVSQGRLLIRTASKLYSLSGE